MGEPASSTTAEIYWQGHEETTISTAQHPPKFGNNLLMTFIPFLDVCTWKTFPPHQQSKSLCQELAFLDILLKHNNGKISVLAHRKPTQTNQYLQYNTNHQTSCQENVVSSFFRRAHSIITRKDDLTTENKASVIIKLE